MSNHSEMSSRDQYAMLLDALAEEPHATLRRLSELVGEAGWRGRDPALPPHPSVIHRRLAELGGRASILEDEGGLS